MTVNEAIILTDKMRFAPEVNRESVSRRYDGVEEVCADKLLWAINNKVGLSSKASPVFDIHYGWSSMEYNNLRENNLADYHGCENGWPWECINHYDGDIASFDHFVCENREPIKYSFYMLAIAAMCMFEYYVFSLEQLEKHEPSDFLEMIDMYCGGSYQFCEESNYNGWQDDEELSDEEVAEDLYNLVYQLVHLYETSSYAPKDAYLKVVGTEASDYLEECIDILSNTFWCDLRHDAIGRFLPFFMIFIMNPGCLACTEDGEVPCHFWVYSRTGVADYKKWRGVYQVAAEPMVHALDKALAIIQQPLIESYSSATGFFYTEDRLVSWMATVSNDYSQFEPFYRAAREVVDTLLPIWEAKYGNYV